MQQYSLLLSIRNPCIHLHTVDVYVRKKDSSPTGGPNLTKKIESSSEIKSIRLLTLLLFVCLQQSVLKTLQVYTERQRKREREREREREDEIISISIITRTQRLFKVLLCVSMMDSNVVDLVKLY